MIFSMATTTRATYDSGVAETPSESDDSMNINGSIELYRLVLTRDWSRVLNHIHDFPQGATFFDDFGLSPLHRACFRDAPLDVVVALVQAFPEATSMQDRCSFSGLTPLHAACHYCSAPVVRCLLQSNPLAIHMLSTKGYTPLQCTCQVYEARLRHHFARIEFENNQLKRKSQPKDWSDIFVEDPILFRFWGVVCLLLQVQVHGAVVTLDDDDFAPSIVHVCAKAAHCVPMILLEFAIKLYPEQLLLPCKITGELPLHIALSQQSPTPSSDAVTFYIFQQNPTAACYQDGSNNFPLMQAIRGGKTWSKFLYPLLHAHPAALYAMNPSAHSLTHIMGKVATTNSTVYGPFSHALCNRLRRKSKVQDAAVVSTMFELLRESPALMDVNSSVSNSVGSTESESKFRAWSHQKIRISCTSKQPVLAMFSYVGTLCKHRLRNNRAFTSKKECSPKEFCTQPPPTD